MRSLQEITDEFGSHVDSYWKGYSGYMDEYTSKGELFDEFQGYCEGLTKVGDRLAKKITGFGVHFCKERIGARRVSTKWFPDIDPQVIRHPEKFIPVPDDDAREVFIKTMGIRKEESFWFAHNPDADRDRIDQARRQWWELQERKHLLAAEYVDTHMIGQLKELNALPMIKSVNVLLDKHGFSTAQRFVGNGSLYEQYQWWIAFKETFGPLHPPTDDDLKEVKKFFIREKDAHSEILTTEVIDRQLDNMARSMNLELKLSFGRLNRFFPDPHQWWKQIEEAETTPVDFDDTMEDKYGIREAGTYFLSSSPKLIEDFEDKVIENIDRVDVLLELYPFRREIIEIIRESEKEDDRSTSGKGNPDWLPPSNDTLQKIVSEANEFLKRDPHQYNPIKKNAWLSNRLRDEISSQLNIPASTVSDYLRKYTKKENSYYKIKTAENDY